MTISVWGLILLIFIWFLFKWLFRVIVLIFIGAVISKLKKRGMEKVEGIARQFTGNHDSAGSSKN
jgi:hypothetical protein